MKMPEISLDRPPSPARHPAPLASPAVAAFTLVELMVAMVVLIILLLGVTSLTNSTASVTNSSNQRNEADQQARMFLDRIQTDLTMMPLRPDYDYQFLKVNGAGGKSGGNDRAYFFSSAPGYSGGMLGATFGNVSSKFLQQRNPVALTGYMIDQQDTGFGKYQARRFGDATLWIGVGSFKGVTAMAPAKLITGSKAAESFTPSSATTIFGSYTKAFIGTNSSTPVLDTKSTLDTEEKLWPILSPSIFRLEFTYLLKDHTYSAKPICYAATNHMGNPVGTTAAGDDPTTKSPGVGGAFWNVGDLWWNEGNHRAFICTRADPVAQTTIWKPYGLNDVLAIVVSIAALDSRARTVLNSSDSANRWRELMGLLSDPTVDLGTGLVKIGQLPMGSITAGTTTTTQLPAQIWSQKLNDAANFKSAVVPITVINQVRVYQRTIYLH